MDDLRPARAPRRARLGRHARSAVPREAFATIDLHFHDLRHECALRWLEKGCTLPTIAQLLGHFEHGLAQGLPRHRAGGRAGRDRAAQRRGLGGGGCRRGSALQPTCSKRADWPASWPTSKGGARRQIAGIT